MLELFGAELRRSWLQIVRYPLESIGGIFITSLFFYGLFASARYVAGPASQFGDRLDALVVGYVLWTLVIFIGADIAGNLQIEAQTGTLEQVFLSPFGGGRVFLARAVVSLLLRLVNLSILLGILMVLTEIKLQLSWGLLPPLLSVVLGAYGVSFGLGSLALLFKRVQQLLTIVQFGLFLLLTVPVETWPDPSRWWGLLLPMTAGAGLLRDLMARAQPLDPATLVLALLVGAGYLSLGFGAFRWAIWRAKGQGGLGQY